LLWRVEWDPVDDPATCRLQGVFAAFAELGVAAEPVVYSDATVGAVREQLSALDGVLVWVNPIEQGLDRSQLDPLLRDAGEAGVWVSAHPDVILKMGTKQVLADTQQMSWGTETHVHRSPAELLERLAEVEGPRVLKQYRGMGGNGVWKVEVVEPGIVAVQHAVRDAVPERLSVTEFVSRCEPYFAGEGRMVEQPFQPRLDEGMVRCYMSHDEVVGFALQYPRGLLPPAAGDAPMPPKRFEEVSAPAYQDLKAQMEGEWMPELKRILDIDAHSLPVIWDADFLRGEDGRYVLCEINVSSTFAFPEHAMPTVARAALERLSA
jgi:hypothetical protein